MPIKNRIAKMRDEIAAWRRDFHEHPELLYDTYRSAGIVAAKLREFGCDEVAEGIGRTGVVGLIRGPSDSGGRASASAPIRRDDDIAALELGEQRASGRTILDGDGAAHAFFNDNLANGP